MSIAVLLLILSPHTPCATAAPYEIPARWADHAEHLMPGGVDFAFDAIEYVPRLGVMVYGDHLLLRVEHGEPFVTLGIAARDDNAAPVRYGSTAVLADGDRLMTRMSVRPEGSARIRETRLVRIDADARSEVPFELPPPSNGAEWTVVRLFTDADGLIFAYAGRGRPTTLPLTFDDVSPALEQRFYRFVANGWQEMSALDPAIVSAIDACFVDGALVVVGNRIEKDAVGNVTVRRGVTAELAGGRWSVRELPPPTGGGAFSMAGLRCGRTRDNIYTLAVAAAPAQAIGHTFLSGTPALYHFDGAAWQPVPLPQRDLDTLGDASRVTAFALDRAGGLWLGYAAAGNRAASLHRYKDGNWTGAALPSVPEVASYSLSGIAFDDDGNGWAIANRNGNATVPESHGILLGYDDDGSPGEKQWRLRGWRWNPLLQRGFGLFGNLR